eukprot:365906-Chlamydomonas_euryale.AAC.25
MHEFCHALYGPYTGICPLIMIFCVSKKHSSRVLGAGDDTEVSPPGWPAQLLGQFFDDDALMCLVLMDKSDPGCPTFPAIHASHMRVFDQMVPDFFINQGQYTYEKPGQQQADRRQQLSSDFFST